MHVIAQITPRCEHTVAQKKSSATGAYWKALLAEDADLMRTLVTRVGRRLLMADRLIPASLDIDGLRGLHSRMEAGTNVVTSIIPPATGLDGVAQPTLDIDDGGRTVAGVGWHLESLGMEAATLDEYTARLARSEAHHEDGRLVAT